MMDGGACCSEAPWVSTAPYLRSAGLQVGVRSLVLVWWVGMMADGFPLPGAEEDGTPASTGQQGCCKHLLVALLERVRVEKCTKKWIPPYCCLPKPIINENRNVVPSCHKGRD